MKHSDVPSSRSTCGANHDLLPIYFSCMPAFRFIPVSLPGFPASNLASKAKEQSHGEDQAVSYGRVQQQTALGPVVPLVPCTGIFLGPSKSGKTVALISMILDRGVFEKIYIFSWIPVKKYIEEDLGVNTERERAYYDEWDEAALRDIIQSPEAAQDH